MFEGDSADMCGGKFSLMLMGGQGNCQACADGEWGPPSAWVEIILTFYSKKLTLNLISLQRHDKVCSMLMVSTINAMLNTTVFVRIILSPTKVSQISPINLLWYNTQGHYLSILDPHQTECLPHSLCASYPLKLLLFMTCLSFYQTRVQLQHSG